MKGCTKTKMMAWLFTKKNNSSGFLKCKYYRFQFIESALESCVPNCQNWNVSNPANELIIFFIYVKDNASCQ